MIRCEQLGFQYNAESEWISFPDITCGKGEQLLLLGQSGSGKTTLLHLLCGILKPGKGNIIINNQSLNDLSERERDQFRGQHFGLVFQKSHFLQSLSVIENLAIPSFLLGEKFNEDQAKTLLDKLGIGNKAHERPRNLSVGEQQRAGIARALIHQPSIVLADEPTSALDDESTEAVISLLEEQAQAVGATLVIVTHDQRLKDRYHNRVSLKSLTTAS